jgi:hypothetical protein
MCAGEAAIVRLTLLFDQFAKAIWLTTFFHKITLVPIHVAADDLLLIESALGYCVEGFPQTYHDLPLSAEKLKLQDFAPLNAKIDHYLSGWCAILLSSGGRVVLLNIQLWTPCRSFPWTRWSCRLLFCESSKGSGEPSSGTLLEMEPQKPSCQELLLANEAPSPYLRQFWLSLASVFGEWCRAGRGHRAAC